MTSELSEKVKASIERIRGFAGIADKWSPDGKSGYYLAFSGGKDSVVVKRLLDMAGVKYDAHYRITSVDPPELVRFIRENHPDVHMERPVDKDGKPITMWNLIPKKRIPPTRLARYCCKFLKEDGGNDRVAITGIRWAESVNRRKNQGIVTVLKENNEVLSELTSENYANTPRGGIVLVNDNAEARRELESCARLHEMVLNPIIDWDDREVWEFIRNERLPYCSLYDDGFARLGCIGCPMAPQREREAQFHRWPTYKRAYLNTFKVMLEERVRAGLKKTKWDNATEVFNWWMGYDILPGQMDLLEDYDG